VKKIFLRCVHPEARHFPTLNETDNERFESSLSHIIELRKLLWEHKYSLTTTPNDSNVVLELHENAYSDAVYKNVPLVGYAVETEFYEPKNYDARIISKYDLFFHFDDDFLKSNPRVLKTTEPRHLSEEYYSQLFPSWRERSLFLVGISGNKNYKYECKNNGYDLRYSLLQYFYRHYDGTSKNKLALYGKGWDLPKKNHGYINHYIFRLLEILSKNFRLSLPRGNSLSAICRGPIDRKGAVLVNSKFSLAIENVYGKSGYVTEKLFDSIRYGCVPIYMGLPSTSFSIPDSLYINIQKFENLDALSEYLKNYDESDYAHWLQVRERFISEKGWLVGSARHWAKNIVNEIQWLLV
jgi:hypothetical protein